MFGFVDGLIIILLLLGAFAGYKRGLFESAARFGRTVLIIVLAYFLKNPISVLLYTNLPFFNFSGFLEGVSVINILIYEAIAFIITLILLSIIFRVIFLLTGFLDKLVKDTVVLRIPSRLLGAVIGILETYVVAFILLFICAQFSFTAKYVNESKMGNFILEKTPIISMAVDKSYSSIKEIYDLQDKYKEYNDKSAYNVEALDIMLENKIISPSSARKLIEKGKITQKEAINVIEKYEQIEKER